MGARPKLAQGEERWVAQEVEMVRRPPYLALIVLASMAVVVVEEEKVTTILERIDGAGRQGMFDRITTIPVAKDFCRSPGLAVVIRD
jgi:hypothetical protein